MCDTFRPLNPTKAALGIDDDQYPASWSEWKPKNGNGNAKEESTSADTW